MNKNLTELVFILDKSGSMAGLESDTIGGFNTLITKQAKERGKAWITTVLFNQSYEVLHDRLPLKNISPLSELDYQVGGTTALLDAVGTAIQRMIVSQKQSPGKERASKVIFVITTDGAENASREFSFEEIKTLISKQKEKHGWEFLFLGANIDAVATAKDFGISEEFAAEYHADEEGTELNFSELSKALSTFRKNNHLDRSWKKEIEADFENRKRK